MGGDGGGTRLRRAVGPLLAASIFTVASHDAQTRDPPAIVVERLARADARLSSLFAQASNGWHRDGGGWVSVGWKSAQKQPSFAVGSRAPDSARDPWEVGIGQSASFRLRLTPEGPRAAPGRLVMGRLVYADVMPDTDEVLIATDSAVELLYLLRGPEAPTTFAWSLDVPPGISTVRSSAGVVSFLDRRGVARLRMPAPYAVDALGARRPLTVDASDRRLVLNLDAHGLAFPLVVDPGVETITWQQAPVLSRRSGAAMAALGSKVVMFGGQHPWGLMNDTWIWDGTVWTLQNPATVPPARSDAAMATFGSTVVMFGGSVGYGFKLDDFWQYDGVDWKALISTNNQGPGPRASAGLASLGGTVVAFSGDNGVADMWIWDGVKWTAGPSGPPGGPSPGMATLGNEIVVLAESQTWLWNGGAWSLQTTSQSPPSGTAHGLASDGSELVVVDYQTPPHTWLYNGNDWIQSAVSPLTANLIDASAGLPGSVVLLNWGYPPDPASAGNLWQWSAGAWGSIPLPPAPTASADAAMAPIGDKVVIFGGETDGTATFSNETWEWDGTSFNQRIPALSPPARSMAAMANDGTSAVLFGGAGSTVLLSDTWLWDGAAWTQASPSQSPPARYGHSMAPLGRSLVMFGGQTGYQAFTDTWTWSNGQWTLEQPPTSPPGMRDCRLASLGTKVVAFGNTDTGPQTWEWDGSTWAQAHSLSTPPYRGAFGMSSTRSHAVVFGGDGGIWLDDTWAWDGVNWMQLTPAIHPPVDWGVVMATRAGSELVLYGGDLWTGQLTLGDGATCTLGTDCLSGFCADGVCCDTACGGGDPTDCEACSVTAGGSTDGTCGPVVMGQLCRPSAGPCDIPEACTGVDLNCPADRLDPMGTVCRPPSAPCEATALCDGVTPTCPPNGQLPDGARCEGVGVCAAGVCVAPPHDGGADGGQADAEADAEAGAVADASAMDAFVDAPGTDAPGDSPGEASSTDAFVADVAAEALGPYDAGEPTDARAEDGALAANTPVAAGGGCSCELNAHTATGAGFKMAFLALAFLLRRRGRTS